MYQYVKFVSHMTGATLIVMRLSTHNDNAMLLANERCRQEDNIGGQVRLTTATLEEWDAWFEKVMRDWMEITT